jgi:hypothetical protein
VVTDDSTLRDVLAARDGPSPQWGRRTGTVVLLLVVVAGACGLFGVRSRTTTSTSAEWRLTVTYPRIARAGLDVPWRVTVHHPGGLPPKLTVAVSTDYFRMFETQGFFPDADSVTGDGRFVYFTFDTPKGSTFLVDYDAYIQPASQIGKEATVKVIVAGATVASSSLRTWLVP